MNLIKGNSVLAGEDEKDKGPNLLECVSWRAMKGCDPASGRRDPDNDGEGDELHSVFVCVLLAVPRIDCGRKIIMAYRQSRTLASERCGVAIPFL